MKLASREKAVGESERVVGVAAAECRSSCSQEQTSQGPSSRAAPRFQVRPRRVGRTSHSRLCILSLGAAARLRLVDGVWLSWKEIRGSCCLVICCLTSRDGLKRRLAGKGGFRCLDELDAKPDPVVLAGNGY
jgi:hypothetical protein